VAEAAEEGRTMTTAPTLGTSQLGPGVFLPDQDALILFQRLNLGAVRERERGRDDRLSWILNAIAVAAFRNIADGGTEARQPAAREERRWWTVPQVAEAAHVSERAVRLDCQHGVLPATKQNRAWLIPNTHAQAYVSGRRKN
jgi:hypothetical protein